MIGLDTNVLVRYLTQDDPEQSEIANSTIMGTVDSGELLWISQITLCETFWVLERAYKLSKNEIIEILYTILEVSQIRFESREVVFQSLRDYQNSKAVGFSDCMIGKQNAHHTCPYTYTFDQAAAKELPTFRLLKNKAKV